MKYDKSIISRLGTMLAVALFALVSFTSCSDDYKKTPLQMPTIHRMVRPLARWPSIGIP